MSHDIRAYDRQDDYWKSGLAAKARLIAGAGFPAALLHLAVIWVFLVSMPAIPAWETKSPVGDGGTVIAVWPVNIENLLPPPPAGGDQGEGIEATAENSTGRGTPPPPPVIGTTPASLTPPPDLTFAAVFSPAPEITRIQTQPVVVAPVVVSPEGKPEPSEATATVNAALDEAHLNKRFAELAAGLENRPRAGQADARPGSASSDNKGQAADGRPNGGSNDGSLRDPVLAEYYARI